MQRIFILSPARTTGKRAGYLLNPQSTFELARRLHHEGGVTLGEAFQFMSGLYFRGKLAYARQFGVPPTGLAAAFVITSNGGMVDVDDVATPERLRRFADWSIDASESRYREPLERSAIDLAARAPNCGFVLLGSIATDKYVDVLSDVFGARLKYPIDFVGRGDMSRGGLLLRAVQTMTELEYATIDPWEKRRGKRPPRLLPGR